MTGREDKVINAIVYIGLTLVALAAVVPILIVVSASFTPYAELLKNGGYVLFPRSFTVDAYTYLWEDSRMPRAFAVTVFITVVGTALNLLLTTFLAYPLSQRRLPGRSILLMGLLMTTLFSAGIIPTYLVVKATGLLDTVWALIIPSAVSVFNVLVMMTFFRGLPTELFESARLDGAGELRTLLQIVVPLSAPVLMTIGLFYGVANWNTFLNAVLYVRDPDLLPLQVVVRDLLVQSVAMDDPDAVVPTVTVRMAAVVVAAVPMIVVYPFVQKYFQKGVLLGSIKG
nr:carbohydrate ABC transporter permease [Jiangella alba]